MSGKTKAPAPEKKRAKKERTDPICEDCRKRNSNGAVPDHACKACREEQKTKGRRLWVSKLQFGTVHLGDMNDLGEQIPSESVDVIFTDPVYLKEVFEDAYARLAELACRVLKPNGFLFMYAPQTHLDEIMDLVRYSNTTSKKQVLHYFWVIESLNGGKSTAKNHQRNAICLHKPILVFQKAPSREEMKGARKCFADVVRGLRQKKFHPWQQSVHDVLGIISRFMAPGEILLDPYAGTGTSLIAGQLLGMEVVGFEIDPKTHAIAVREMQQKPMDLSTFGGDLPEIPPAREAHEEKDTTHQGELEDPTMRARPKKLRKEACNDCEVSKLCKHHDPHTGCTTEVLLLHEKHEDPAKLTREDPDHGPQELNAACRDCDVLDKCTRKDPYAGCRDGAIAVDNAVKEASKSPEESTPDICKNCQIIDCEVFDSTSPNCLLFHPEARAKRKAAEEKPPGYGACETCGHHKGRKTFRESCPRIGELLFKGGKKSAGELIEGNHREPCKSWSEKPGKPVKKTRGRKAPYAIEIKLVTAPELKRQGRKYDIECSGPLRGMAATKETREQTLRCVINWLNDCSVTEAAVLFSDSTGEFRSEDFFDKAGKPMKPKKED